MRHAVLSGWRRSSSQSQASRYEQQDDNARKCEAEGDAQRHRNQKLCLNAGLGDHREQSYKCCKCCDHNRPEAALDGVDDVIRLVATFPLPLIKIIDQYDAIIDDDAR